MKGRDNLIRLESGKTYVWQWTPKEHIILEGYPDGVFVRYANCNTVEAPVVQSRRVGDKLIADIPPELMQVDLDITVYVCNEDGILHCHYLSVLSNPKPASYVYEPVEVLRYETLAKRIPFNDSYEGMLLRVSGGVAKPLALGDGLYLEGDALHAAGGGGGSSGPAYVASETPPENTDELWVDTSEPEEAVALGVTATETAEGVDLYCTDELGTVKASLRHGKDGKDGDTPVKGVDYFDGEPGKNGTTPRIGDNGNWWLGDTDTGKPSRGEQGPKYELTEEDKQEFTGAVLDALPKWTGGAY